MSVPNDVVGSVIGKRGSKINEIRQIRFGKNSKHVNVFQWGHNQHHGKWAKEEGEKPRARTFGNLTSFFIPPIRILITHHRTERGLLRYRAALKRSGNHDQCRK